MYANFSVNLTSLIEALCNDRATQPMESYERNNANASKTWRSYQAWSVKHEGDVHRLWRCDGGGRRLLLLLAWWPRRKRKGVRRIMEGALVVGCEATLILLWSQDIMGYLHGSVALAKNNGMLSGWPEGRRAGRVWAAFSLTEFWVYGWWDTKASTRIFTRVVVDARASARLIEIF